MNANWWILPEGIEEVLPPRAARLEQLCRGVIDLFQTWGYQLVMPPLVEFLESLLTGTGEDLDLQTFKVTDQLSGRLMGIRADMTPQAARIDARLLKSDYPVRLCYLGTVLHTLPAGPGGTRAPLQVGAELYGHAGPESDAEILVLMLRALELAGVRGVHVDLGHVGIYRGIVADIGLAPAQEKELFGILQRKAAHELRGILDQWSVPAAQADMLFALTELGGAVEELAQARSRLRKSGKAIQAGLDDLERIVELVQRQVRDAPLYFDLADLRGYHYHTGMMFSTFVPGQGQGVANGGRYDDIAAAFDRPRPATGFSTDLKQLFALGAGNDLPRGGIFAPCSEVPGIIEAIDSLRREGETVICELPGQPGGAAEMDCDRELVLEHGRWTVKQVGKVKGKSGK